MDTGMGLGALGLGVGWGLGLCIGCLPRPGFSLARGCWERVPPGSRYLPKRAWPYSMVAIFSHTLYSAFVVMLLGVRCLGWLGSCVGEGVASGVRRAVGASCPATACLGLLCRVSPFLAPQPPPAPWKQCRAILRNLGGGWFVGEGGRARGRGGCGNTFRSGFPFPLHARPCRVHLHLNLLPPSSFFRKRVDSGVWMAWGGWRVAVAVDDL